MLDYEGVDYKRFDLPPAASWAVLKTCPVRAWVELTAPAG